MYVEPAPTSMPARTISAHWLLPDVLFHAYEDAGKYSKRYVLMPQDDALVTRVVSVSESHVSYELEEATRQCTDVLPAKIECRCW